MIKRWIWVIVISLGLISSIYMVGIAVPPIPYRPQGDVQFNGGNAPEGTVITAYCGDEQYGYTESFMSSGVSKYKMNVLGDDPATTDVKEGCYPGETVTFKVMSVTADQQGVWTSGTENLNLTATKPEPNIAVEKRVNGQDADLAPGPYLIPGDDLTWTYTVTNTGETNLNDVFIWDDNGTPEDTGDDLEVCGPYDLGIGASQSCTLTGVVQHGAFVNVAKATGIPPDDPPVSATDPAHYFGYVTSANLVKLTNDQDVDIVEQIYVESDGTVSWTYVVENTGNVPLTGVSVTDDKEVSVTCPKDSLEPGESMTCTASGPAVEGQYENTGTVWATPPVGSDVTASDLSHYFGSKPGIEIVKKANAGIYTAADPLYIIEGDPVTWTFELHNSGNVDLTDVTVVDDPGTPGDPSDDTIICSGITLKPDPDPQAFHICSLEDTAVSGAYHNTATVAGSPPVGLDVTASADSYYVGSDPDVAIDFKVNNSEADTDPGLHVLAGTEITLDYLVTNTGNVDLTNLVVKNGTTEVCTIASLDPGASDTCTENITAIKGQQSATAFVSGSPPSPLDPVAAEDPMYYFGAEPVLTLDKQTNGQDPSSTPGVYVETGSTVNWSYALSNDGNVKLENVRVVDDNGTPEDLTDDETVCSEITLFPSGDPGGDSTYTCSWSKPAVEGQYTNIAVAYGDPPSPLSEITAEDTSYYFGATLIVTLEKSTNGEDADIGTGPLIGVGGLVEWVYVVTNASNVDIDFSIVDNPTADISCPTTTLAVGENTICTASDIAEEGQYENTATVTYIPPDGLASDTVQDTSHYFGVITGLVLEKKTNGFDADAVTGPVIKVGEPVTWNYEITNTGNVDLSSVSLLDDVEGPVSCPSTTVAAGDTMICTKTGTAVEGQYSNLATVTADPPTGFSQVSDSDPSHYYGSDAGVSLTKLTNGSDSVPYILVNGDVVWTYLVENVGNLPLSDVDVWDSDPTLTVTCDTSVLNLDGQLEPGVTMTCSAAGIAIEGRYDNTGFVEAVPLGFEADKVQASDTSAYFGANPSITIEKYTNGEDADTGTGPYIPVGTGETPVNFDYQISNLEADYTFTDIHIIDDRGTPDDPGDDLEINCSATSLAPGESMSCDRVTDIVEPGQHASAAHVLASAWVEGDEPQMLGEVNASDPGYYFGYTEPGLMLTKFTNGQFVEAPPGPELSVGSIVTWNYDVTNESNAPVRDLTVEDSDTLVAISCEKTELAGNETITCSASGEVVGGQYSNTAQAFGVFIPTEETVTSTAALSYYYGVSGSKIFLPLLMR